MDNRLCGVHAVFEVLSSGQPVERIHVSREAHSGKLRQILELGLHAMVLPGQVAISHVATAFDEKGGLKDENVAKLLRESLTRLIRVAEAEL